MLRSPLYGIDPIGIPWFHGWFESHPWQSSWHRGTDASRNLAYARDRLILISPQSSTTASKLLADKNRLKIDVASSMADCRLKMINWLKGAHLRPHRLQNLRQVLHEHCIQPRTSTNSAKINNGGWSVLSRNHRRRPYWDAPGEEAMIIRIARRCGSPT